MEFSYLVIVGFAGVFIGGLIVYAFQHSKVVGIRAELESQVAVLQEREQGRASQLESLVKREREASEEKLQIITNAQKQLQDAFKALSAEALKSNNQSFLDLATRTLDKFQEGAKGELEKRQQAIDSLVKPVKETLEKFDTKLQDMEKSRVGAYEGLVQQVKSLGETQGVLRSETANLVKALGTPRVRGRWGELQLRRVVELAGMIDHCDFFEQQSVTTEDGRLRPDLLIRLPGGRNVVVDAKAPLAGYLEALDAPDEATKIAKLADHTRHIREHIASLEKKSYWEQFSPSPEFVVLFLPGEVFYSVALEQDPTLIERGVESGVVVATPTTLIALLKSVAFGWKQERLAESAKEIALLGNEIYKRLGDLSKNFNEVGARLGKAVESYNKAVGTLETRVLSSGRKFKELNIGTAEIEIEVVETVDTRPRPVQSAELIEVEVEKKPEGQLEL